MNMPGYAAEAALYITGQLYRGYGAPYGADAAAIRAAQVPCQVCSAQFDSCIQNCLWHFGWDVPGWILCNHDCSNQMDQCQQTCTSPPLPPPECCPPGLKCCGSCVVLPNGGERCVGGPCARFCP